jgi:hypothetical protein
MHNQTLRRLYIGESGPLHDEDIAIRGQCFSFGDRSKLEVIL